MLRDRAAALGIHNTLRTKRAQLYQLCTDAADLNVPMPPSTYRAIMPKMRGSPWRSLALMPSHAERGCPLRACAALRVACVTLVYHWVRARWRSRGSGEYSSRRSKGGGGGPSLCGRRRRRPCGCASGGGSGALGIDVDIEVSVAGEGNATGSEAGSGRGRRATDSGEDARLVGARRSGSGSRPWAHGGDHLCASVGSSMCVAPHRCLP